MQIDELRVAIARAPRAALPEIRRRIYEAFAEEQITEAEVQDLEAAIGRRIEAAVIPPSPPPRRVGSRPRTPESLLRRRRWAAAGRMPPHIAATYTTAQQAVLAVVSAEIAQHGACRLTIAQIAGIAGVAAITAKLALRIAREAGHILVQHRPRPGGRHDSNVVTIIASDWIAWMRLTRKSPTYHGGGDIVASRTHTGDPKRRPNRPVETVQKASEPEPRRPPRLHHSAG